MGPKKICGKHSHISPLLILASIPTSCSVAFLCAYLDCKHLGAGFCTCHSMSRTMESIRLPEDESTVKKLSLHPGSLYNCCVHGHCAAAFKAAHDSCRMKKFGNSRFAGNPGAAQVIHDLKWKEIWSFSHPPAHQYAGPHRSTCTPTSCGSMHVSSLHQPVHAGMCQCAPHSHPLSWEAQKLSAPSHFPHDHFARSRKVAAHVSRKVVFLEGEQCNFSGA